MHALNRFTFGPRPGDVGAVQAMGLDRWFEQQLHPASMDNSALQRRLAQYPAMQWTPEELLFRLPNNAVIRQAIDGKVPVPQQGVLRVIYENQIARVSAKRQEQEQKRQMAGASAPPMDHGGMSEMQMQPAAVRNQSEMMDPGGNAGGPDPSLVPALLALPPQQRLARLAAMPQPDLDALLKSLKGPQRAALTSDLSPEMRETAEALENPERVVVTELMAERLTRDIYSTTQLQEVMADFWLNHFNVYLRKNEAMPYYLVSYERDVIRPHALAKFEDLLEAVAHSPAMLIYLDNASSIGPDSLAASRANFNRARNPEKNRKAPEGLNENYARELMELHTLGVNGGYSQADVIQAARILTGWSVDRPQRGGGFQFDERRHEPGSKKVLGKKFKDHGEREGRDLLHMLATQPATARFIARKLAIRFVGDDPSPALVDRLSKSYLSSGGDIAVVMKTMFRSPEFWSAGAYQTKVKTPLEFIVSAARASNADIANMEPLINQLRAMGMPLYGCVPPTGYKWDAEDWVSTGALVNRMNFALSLAANRLNGISTNWIPLAEDVGAVVATPQDSTPDSEEARLEPLLIPAGVSQSTRAAVLQQFEKQSAGNGGVGLTVSAIQNRPRRAPTANEIERKDQLLAGLLLGSPEFQRR